MTFEIVCCISSHDSLTYNYVTPLALHPRVSKVWIVRTHESAYGKIPKAEYVLVKKRWMPLRLLHMLWTLYRLGRRPEVRAYASFNPFPYGTLALIAAKLWRKPIHLGFIGDDMDRHLKGPLGSLLAPVARGGDFITVTGTRMRADALARGVDPDRCAVLPHGIDLSRFPVATDSPKPYAFVHVGELIQRKRVDIVIRAFADLAPAHPEARLAIVGRGRLRPELESLTASLGVTAQVDFVGYVNDVQSYFARSRVVVAAAEREGFPFSLVEGCCSGLVPVTTPVGTILDHVRDGVNGLIVPVGEVKTMSLAMRRLIEDEALYLRLRTEALKLREVFSFEAATRVWAPWLETLPPAD
jgi:glycosyltransferase involved in cell wall biosynthesis